MEAASQREIRYSIDKKYRLFQPAHQLSLMIALRQDNNKVSACSINFPQQAAGNMTRAGPRFVNMVLYEPLGDAFNLSKCRQALIYQRVSAFANPFQQATKNQNFFEVMRNRITECYTHFSPPTSYI